MIGYIIRRVIVAIIVTIGIAVISFLLLHYLSPSPVYAVLGAKATPQAAAAWNKSHGFDRPETAQLLTYLGHLFGCTSATPTSSARASARCSRRTPAAAPT